MRLRFLSRAPILAGLLLAGLATAPARLAGQEHEAAPAAQEHGAAPAGQPSAADIIMPHILDSKEFEYPCPRSWREWACEAELPTWNVQIGSKTVDLGPTRHVVWLAIAAFFMLVILALLTRGHVRSTDALGRPVGTPAGLEAVVLYLRNEIYLPVLGGHGGGKYFTFVISLFFFILAGNVIGLIPFTSTPTGNISVTAALALMTFLMIEFAGIKELGAGYLGTIVYWPHAKPGEHPAMRLLTLIMTPIEILSKFTKPFALTIRLFANMIAGHIIILSLILLVFTIKIAFPFWIGMGVFISLLEGLVVVIQAFIFSLLAAVFIGQIRSAHH